MNYLKQAGIAAAVFVALTLAVNKIPAVSKALGK